MTTPDPEFFRKSKFSKTQIAGYLKNAFRDLEIAAEDSFVEVRFTYAYQALIKAGLALLAHEGVKVRALPGHHIRILEAVSRILKDPDAFTVGNAMRMKRNEDLYGEGGFVSEKEAEEYLESIQAILDRARKLIT